MQQFVYTKNRPCLATESIWEHSPVSYRILLFILISIDLEYEELVFGTEFWVLSVIWKHFSSPESVTVWWLLESHVNDVLPRNSCSTQPSSPCPNHKSCHSAPTRWGWWTEFPSLANALDTWYVLLHPFFTAEFWRTTADPTLCYIWANQILVKKQSNLFASELYIQTRAEEYEQEGQENSLHMASPGFCPQWVAFSE